MGGDIGGMENVRTAAVSFPTISSHIWHFVRRDVKTRTRESEQYTAANIRIQVYNGKVVVK